MDKIRITQRDISIMRELYNSRFLTTRQLTDLCFDGKHEAAKKRIQKLKRGGFIEAKSIAFGTIPLLFLSTGGQAWVLKHLGLQKQGRFRVSLATLGHELALRDWIVRIRLESASLKVCCEHSPSPVPLRLSRFTDECVKPDAQINITTEGNESSFFVELDTGSQSHKVVIRKLQAYLRLAQVGVQHQLILVFTRPNRMRRILEKHRSIIERVGCRVVSVDEGRIVERLVNRKHGSSGIQNY